MLNSRIGKVYGRHNETDLSGYAEILVLQVDNDEDGDDYISGQCICIEEDGDHLHADKLIMYEDGESVLSERTTHRIMWLPHASVIVLPDLAKYEVIMGLRMNRPTIEKL